MTRSVVPAVYSLRQDASPSAVVAALKAKNIKVSPAAVSNVKAYARQGANGRKAGGKPAKGKGDLLSLADLQAAKRLVDQLGSVEAAQSAVGVLAKLR